MYIDCMLFPVFVRLSHRTTLSKLSFFFCIFILVYKIIQYICKRKGKTLYLYLFLYFLPIYNTTGRQWFRTRPN